MKVCLDAGHGIKTPGKRTPKFEDGSFIHEAEQNYKIMEKVSDHLVRNGIEVACTNKDIQYDMPLRKRASIEKKAKVDMFVSIHKNASRGTWQTYAKGIETFVHKKGFGAERIAKIIHKHLINDTNMMDRGITEGYRYINGKPIYVLKETDSPAILLELGFMDFKPEAEQMKSTKWHDKYAKAIAKGICEHFGVQFKDIDLTPIISKPTATLEQMKQWAVNKKVSQEFINLASMYYTMAHEIGINPVMAYAQCAHETGFLYKIPSAAGLDTSYHNPCGLKITQGGGDHQASAHKRFLSWEDGISAHLDHLALYAGVSGYPKKNTLDPRHSSWIFGKAKYVESLSGNWAPSKSYASKFLRYMKEIEKTVVVPVVNEELEKATLKIKVLEAEKTELLIQNAELQETINQIKVLTERWK